MHQYFQIFCQNIQNNIEEKIVFIFYLPHYEHKFSLNKKQIFLTNINQNNLYISLQ